MWKMPRIWEGGECWIIGGGPSVVQQFQIPTSVVEGVKNKTLPPSTYSPYMEALHDKHVIGVNMALHIGDWIDMLFFGDPSFFDKNKEDIDSFPGLKITTANTKLIRAWPNIKIMERLPSIEKYGISTNPRALRWNTNSGGAAINLAYHTGVKRIYLLGYDMSDGEAGTHWHQMYGLRKQSPHARHEKCFPKIAKDAKELGIEIININPNSRITAFKKASLQDVL